RHAPVTFEYRGETRTVEPWGLAARRGHWYLVGHDRARDAMRTFRADRLGDDITVGEPDSFVVPDDFSPDQSLDNEPWQYGDGARARRRRSRERRGGARRPRRRDARRRIGRHRARGREPARVPLARARAPRTRRGARTPGVARRPARVPERVRVSERVRCRCP